MLEEILEAIRAAGLRVNNLYQADDGSWRCHLVKDFPAAEGASAKEALETALNVATAFGPLKEKVYDITR